MNQNNFELYFIYDLKQTEKPMFCPFIPRVGEYLDYSFFQDIDINECLNWTYENPVHILVNRVEYYFKEGRYFTIIEIVAEY